MLWDNKLGWIPYDKKVYAARYRLAYQVVPDWKYDPTYDLVAETKAKRAHKAKYAAITAKRKAEEHP
jgi:hypothetical protein